MPPTVRVPGATLAYDVAGPADAPAVLFVHAGVATRAMWDPQFDDLSADHRVVRYDTRGYGESPGEPVPYSECDDLIRILDAAEIERAVIVGASRGGRFALDAALAHPDRVTGLVLVGSRPSGYAPAESEWTELELQIWDAVDVAVEADDFDAVVRLEVQLYDVGPTRDTDEVDPVFLQRAIELNVGAEHRGFSGSATPPARPAVGRLSELQLPVLVVVGDHDVSVVRTASQLLLEDIAAAEELRYPDAAHLLTVEHPERFTGHLRDWLARNPATTSRTRPGPASRHAL